MTQHNLIAPYIKQEIYQRQNGLCAYCNRYRNIKYMTVDHIIPLSKGGTNKIDNLQCTCKMCNRLKDNMMPNEFTVFVRCILLNSMKIEQRMGKGGVSNG